MTLWNCDVKRLLICLKCILAVQFVERIFGISRTLDGSSVHSTTSSRSFGSSLSMSPFSRSIALALPLPLFAFEAMAVPLTLGDESRSMSSSLSSSPAPSVRSFIMLRAAASLRALGDFDGSLGPPFFSSSSEDSSSSSSSLSSDRPSDSTPS